jgi:phosphate:Na+ symporter
MFELVTLFLGGIALFLLGMKMLTDGLKLSAGDSLRNLLAHWTSTPTKGVMSGVLITAIVQSSSAVVFATIGFVNAGIMSLLQAVYVVFGSNVGTTFTGWIVSTVGLNINLQALAMPFLALGMILWLGQEGTKRGGLGQALVGLSVFFLGIDVLKDAFQGFGDDIPIEALGNSLQSRLLMLGIGIGLTTLMQSSSAAIAIVITAVAGGFLPLHAGATMVIGADIGTTSTALFAVIGSTSSAKRTATAHVLFNVVTGVVAFFLVGAYLKGIALLFGPEISIAATVAMFHTMKKLTGLIIFIPFTDQLVSWLERHFVGSERPENKPKYLDDTLLQTPSLAVSALVFELKRVGKKSRKAVRHVLMGDRSHKELDLYVETVEHLHLEVVAYIQKMHRLNMPPNLEYSLPQALRVLQYFREASEHAMAALHIKEQNNIHETVTPELKRLEDVVLELTLACDSETTGFSLDQVRSLEDQVEVTYNEVKIAILTLGGQEKISVQSMLNLHEMIRNYKRVADQLSKAAQHMDNFNKLIQHIPGEGPGMRTEE